jgi:GR25 family glycosyltransferase involved in LPS biosynthesis
MNIFQSIKQKFLGTNKAITQTSEQIGLGKLSLMFDAIICLSMPNDTERRNYIQQYFSELEIQNYQFFDATEADAPIVEEYYWQELVRRYPTCFRCNKLECGKEDCNNVLIPSQVATAISHKRIWEFILEHRLRNAIIVEDDIRFNDYAPLVLGKLSHLDAFQKEFQSHTDPCLLRLGWKLKEEHQYNGTVELSPNVIRMSNPCYAMNAAMARVLVENFHKVDTTVDVYTHRWMAPKYNNYTLFPPLAHELSASIGQMRSLIHPKSWRIDYLREQGASDAEILQEEKFLNDHIKHAIIRDILAVGHPRCGSGYMGQLFQVFGLNVGHESMQEQGISSWMFAVDDAYYPYGKNKYSRSRRYTYFKHIIHHVRSPQDAIPSILVENQYSEKSFEFRRKHIQRNFDIDLRELSAMDAAVASFILWNQLAERMNPALTIRIENDESKLFQYLKQESLLEIQDFPQSLLPSKTVNTRKPYKGQVIEKPTLTLEDWKSVSNPLKEELRSFCLNHQYDYPLGM